MTTRGMVNSSGGFKPDDVMMIDPAEKDAFYVLLLKTHIDTCDERRVFQMCIISCDT